MRTLKNGLVLSAAAMVLIACNDRPESAPTAPARRPVSLDVSIAAFATLACDFTLLKADARDFAVGGDLLHTIINDLQNAKRTSTPAAVAAANDKVFDALARMAAVRGTSAQKTGVVDQGVVFDHLVHRLFGCASSNISANALEQNFSAALGNEWLFEVRGKISDPTGTYNDPPGVAYERGAPAEAWWAVQNTGLSWNESITSTALAKRVLIYGYRTSYFGDPQGKLGTGFETRTIPHIQTSSPAFALAVKVGLCVDDDQNPATPITPTQRVNHDGTFFPKLELTCGADAPPYIVASGSNPLNSFAQYAMLLFAPKPAHAAAVFNAGSIAAAPSELSPSAIFDLGLVRVSYNGDVVDTRINQQLRTLAGDVLTVRAMSPDNKGLPDVIIRLEIVGNQSSIAFFRDGNQNMVSVTRETDANGDAIFTGVGVTKAGQHTLSAKVDVAGVVGPGILSNKFTVQNKTP